ncbi:MAG: hypothetical protein AB2551_03070 [Candidatus Thiodiazotropha sp.]
MAVGNASTILVSSDGASWTQSATPVNYGNLYGVAWSGIRWAETGTQGRIITLD